MSTIFISLGHNNALNARNIFSRDQGAVSNGVTELSITREIARLLPARYKGNDKICFVPEKLSLVDRVAWINKKAIDGDIAIELHMNSGGGTGTEVFYYAGSDKMKAFASKMSASLSTAMNIKDRGAKEDTTSRFGRLGFIRDTKPIAFLIEFGFLDNPYDQNQVKSFGSSSFAIALKSIFG